jgi:hypothetical protein
MWSDILKRGKGFGSKHKYVLQRGITDSLQSEGEILSRIRSYSKMGGNINSYQLKYILKKLKSDGAIEQIEDKFRLVSNINKSDWKKTIDNLVSKDTMFEKIYDTLAKKMKFSTPSKSEVLNYLSENYQRHKLWSNLWSKKED